MNSNRIVHGRALACSAGSGTWPFSGQFLGLTGTVGLCLWLGRVTSSAVLGQHVVAPVDYNLFIYASLRVSVFESLVGRDACLVGIQIKEAHPPNVVAVPAVSAEASATSIAHPELWLLLFICRKHAVFVGVVTGYNI